MTTVGWVSSLILVSHWCVLAHSDWHFFMSQPQEIWVDKMIELYVTIMLLKLKRCSLTLYHSDDHNALLKVNLDLCLNSDTVSLIKSYRSHTYRGWFKLKDRNYMMIILVFRQWDNSVDHVLSKENLGMQIIKGMARLDNAKVHVK